MKMKWKEDRNVICGSCPFNRKMSSPKGKWMCTSHTCSPFILITPDGVLALCTDGKGRQVSVARHRLINIRHISPQPLSAMHTARFQICFAIEKSQLCICIWKRAMSYKGQGSLFLTGSNPLLHSIILEGREKDWAEEGNETRTYSNWTQTHITNMSTTTVTC